jgi:hypothetical protein
MESSKIPLIMYLKKKHLPSGRKEKNRCWADPFFTLNLYSLVAVLRNQGRCFLSVIPSS